MRVALAGKGGTGKTTIAATLARAAARQGVPVVAVDADSNPNLAAALGLPPGIAPAPLPAGVVSRRLQGPALSRSLEDVLDEHAITAPDGVRLTAMGMPRHADEGCLCSAHATVSATLADLGTRPEVLTVVDMEASPEHLSRGTARHVDVLLLVTEAYYRSLETVRRMAVLAAELPIARVGVVANKVRSDDDRQAITDFCARHDLALIGFVPWSDAVIEADLAATPLIEHTGDGATAAITGLLPDLLAAAPRA